MSAQVRAQTHDPTIQSALKWAKRLHAAYASTCAAPNCFPRSVDDLLKALPKVRKDFCVEINVLQVRSNVVHAMAALENIRAQEKRQTIYLTRDMPTSRIRFVIVKEVLQLLLDHPGARASELSRELDDMLKYLRRETRWISAKKSTAAELAANIAAMEFCYPFAQRSRVSVDQLNISRIADSYGLPEDIVRAFHSERVVNFLGRFFDAT